MLTLESNNTSGIRKANGLDLSVSSGCKSRTFPTLICSTSQTWWMKIDQCTKVMTPKRYFLMLDSNYITSSKITSLSPKFSMISNIMMKRSNTKSKWYFKKEIKENNFRTSSSKGKLIQKINLRKLKSKMRKSKLNRKTKLTKLEPKMRKSKLNRKTKLKILKKSKSQMRI